MRTEHGSSLSRSFFISSGCPWSTPTRVPDDLDNIRYSYLHEVGLARDYAHMPHHTSRDRRTVRETRLNWNKTTADWISQVEKVGRGQSEVDF